MQSPDRQRLAHILDYCVEIEKTIARYGADFSAFDHDADYQRSISFSILQIGELSGKLSAEFRTATAGRIQWGPIKGMRNLVAHSYGSMSREIIWETAITDIPVLKQFCQEYLAENTQPDTRIRRDHRSPGSYLTDRLCMILSEIRPPRKTRYKLYL